MGSIQYVTSRSPSIEKLPIVPANAPLSSSIASNVPSRCGSARSADRTLHGQRSRLSWRPHIETAPRSRSHSKRWSRSASSTIRRLALMPAHS